VLAHEHDIASAVHECYRWVREGWSVVAVVSAIGDTTDRLVAASEAYGHAPSPHAAAALISTGESVSASHLWLGCDRAGIDAVAVDPREIGLRVAGTACDATPVGVDARVVRGFCAQHDVVIVPGFFGIDDRGRIALLGRGGSDLTAVLVAEALGARCRLLKDVAGLYERDPARPGPFARRYASITFADADRLDGAILQRKALRHAARHDWPFEVAALHRDDATRVGAETTEFSIDDRAQRLRVALLGFGVVGRGVWHHLSAARGGFDVVGVSVRSPKRHADAIAPRLLARDALALAAERSSDVVVETIGGIDVARSAVAGALARGADVVTANKALIAGHGLELAAIARDSGARLVYSAAVGGAAPILERATQLRPSGVVRVEAVLNGTTNFMLSAQASGASFDDALAEAQALGFAESDPTADIDGSDAADKLRLVCRAAFGADPSRIKVSGLARGVEVSTGDRLVARAAWSGGDLVASVGVERLEPGHALLDAHGVWNLACFETADGARAVVRGKGAGRFPTAESIFSDLLDMRRARSAVRGKAVSLVGGAS
jgi:homoserine dehydrogenase